MVTPLWLDYVPVAHRGLHDATGGVPENSLAAFDAAVAGGYAIELDVRVTRDGQAVVFHDDELSRMTGRPGAVAAASADELPQLRLQGTAQAVPLLAEVLARVNARAPLLVEIKNEGEPGPVEEAALAVLARYSGPFAVQSFNAETLVWWARRAPDAARGLLYSARTSAPHGGRDFLETLAQVDARRARVNFLGLDARALPLDREATAALKANFTLLAWTITSPAAERDARRWCHNVIFEGYRPEHHPPPGDAVV